MMKFNLALERLRFQRIGFLPFENPIDVVQYMCGLQAQDYEMARWAIAVRMKNPESDRITRELDSGLILRTHIFRPTWHFIPGEDLKWMMNFSAPYIKKLNASQENKIGLDQALLTKTKKIIEKAFKDHTFLTKEEIVLALNRDKINTDGLRPIHILFDAECSSLICSGPKMGHQHTYALLDSRVPSSIKKTNEEALAELTKRYFQSHGPASIKDLAKWMSISLNKAKEGVALIGQGLDSITIDEYPHYFIPRPESPPVISDTCFLLPAYDEYLIGYADRSFALEEKFGSSTVTTNGIFNPIIVHHGKVKGSWKRKKNNTGFTVELIWYYPPNPTLLKKVKNLLKGYEKFIGKTIDIVG